MSGAAAPEVARFLRDYPPFDALDPAEVERVAAAAEVEFHRAGTTIFSQGAEPVEHLRVIRSGAVEIVPDGRVLDLLGAGELFGQASMLSGLPTGFEARAAEDTLCYRIAADAAPRAAGGAGGTALRRALAARALGRSCGSGPGRGARRPGPPAGRRADPRRRRGLRTRDVDPRGGERMAAAPATSVVVELGGGSLGIVTDRDLRTRVVAAGLSGDQPVSAAMSAPAYTCGPDRLGGEVLLEMLDRGFRHFPVVSATGEILGVVEDIDLVAAQTRSSFFLRQPIARAAAIRRARPRRANAPPDGDRDARRRVAAANIMAVYAVVVDALTRRLLELAIAEAGDPGSDFAWLALGSQARREAMPSSDVDSAIVWFGDARRGRDPTVPARRRHAGGRGLEACGLRPDEHGATAATRCSSARSSPGSARSAAGSPTPPRSRR